MADPTFRQADKPSVARIVSGALTTGDGGTGDMADSAIAPGVYGNVKATGTVCVNAGPSSSFAAVIVVSHRSLARMR